MRVPDRSCACCSREAAPAFTELGISFRDYVLPMARGTIGHNRSLATSAQFTAKRAFEFVSTISKNCGHPYIRNIPIV